jgi:hypothetical protein
MAARRKRAARGSRLMSVLRAIPTASSYDILPPMRPFRPPWPFLLVFWVAASPRPATAFQPDWDLSLGLGFTTQEGGSTQQELSLSADHAFPQPGHRVGLGLTVSRQGLEGTHSESLGFQLSAGLGIGRFHPGLSLSGSRGESTYRSLSVGGVVDLDLSRVWSLSVGYDHSRQSHVGPVLQLLGLPQLTAADYDALIRSHGDSLSLGVGWDPSSGIRLSPAVSRSWDVTDRVESLSGRRSLDLGQKGRTDQVSLSLSLRVVRGLQGSLSGSLGEQRLPQSGFYDPRTQRTVVTAEAATVGFKSLTMGLTLELD